MLKSLKFVKGAVAKDGFIPALTHFRIAHGTVRGFNGQMGLYSPIPTDLDCSPNAKQFVRALDACKETVVLHLKNGRLAVQSGAFKAMIDCDNPENFPDVSPGGRFFNLPPSFYNLLVQLEPFIGDDPNRPWSHGILLAAQSMFATNNIVAIEGWHGLGLTEKVNLPVTAIREMIRIDEAPYRMQIEPHRVSFHWPDGRWLTTQVIENTWPDVAVMLDKLTGQPQEAIPDALWPALGQLLGVCDAKGACWFLGDKIATGNDPEDAGASVDVMGIPTSGVFNARQVGKLKGVAKTASFSSYPAPVGFFGSNCRGALMGMKIT